MPYLTKNILKQSKHNKGWYKEQLEILDIPFPPPKDWKINVINKIYSQDTINQFINFSTLTTTNTLDNDNNEELKLFNDNFNSSNTGQRWSKIEDHQLNHLYNIEKLDLIEIMKYHKRNAGGICSRLKKLNYISDKKQIRGYNEYMENYEICKSIHNSKLTKTIRIRCKNNNELTIDMNKIKDNINELTININKIKYNMDDMNLILNNVNSIITNNKDSLSISSTKIIDNNLVKLTQKHITLAMSGSGGYKKKQIEILGLTWPLEKGWKKKVIDKYYPKIDIDRFVNYNKSPPSITEFFNSSTETINIEPDIIVYTDGSCSNNGLPNAMAGIGIYFNDNDPRNVSRRVVGKQSNNTAELTAIIETLHILQEDINNGKIIHIYSDSKYAIRCCTEYGKKCELNKWEKPIPNKELVKQAYQLKKKYPNVELIYIKAHTNNTDIYSLGNDGADRLANQAIGLETCPYNTRK